MSRLSIIALMLALVIVVVACDEGSPEVDTTTSETMALKGAAPMAALPTEEKAQQVTAPAVAAPVAPARRANPPHITESCAGFCPGQPAGVIPSSYVNACDLAFRADARVQQLKAAVAGGSTIAAELSCGAAIEAYIEEFFQTSFWSIVPLSVEHELDDTADICENDDIYIYCDATCNGGEPAEAYTLPLYPNSVFLCPNWCPLPLLSPFGNNKSLIVNHELRHLGTGIPDNANVSYKVFNNNTLDEAIRCLTQ